MSTSVPGGNAPPRCCALAARLVLAAAVCPAAFAQAGEDPIVITASRLEERLSQTLGDVSLVERSTIERSGASNVADLLARLPGIEIARNGGPGTSTSVYVRGGETRHTAVYVDGVRVDSQSTGGAPWEQIPLERIERIEVLRGPAAAVYGSDAVGGVVQLFTRRGQGALRTRGGLGWGSRGTRQADAGLSGATGSVDYALSAGWSDSNGFSAREGQNPDADGWRRGSLQARAGWQFAPEHRVEASFLESHLHAQYDGSTTDDDLSHHELRTGALAWRGQWNDDALSSARLSESQGSYETEPSPYRTETRLRDLVLQHEQRVAAGQRLSLTLERREDRLENPATARSARLAGERAQNGVAVGWRGEFGAHSLQAHARHDDDSEFGTKSTGSLAWGWRFASTWRFTASAATSFRAPTLYQRFSQYGNPDLVPETGRNLEFGLRRSAGDDELGLVAWRNKVDELIAFGAAGPCTSTSGCYENVGKASYEGLTLSGRTRVGALALRGSLDFHEPKNELTGTLIARRARRLATLGADTELAGWQLGAEVQAAGQRWDDAANTRRLGGYGLVNLSAERRLGEGLKLQARIDNAGGKDYALARSYAVAGRSASVALRWTL
ncbi:TonB-dependent receptor domain-containing protein [Rubrivivax gelatinosus]|uniref:TonB-dependent receptor domain-containing protein n=1 Tax=Rubrivivax gelatinosus TaxID=28068 RepID=UPI00104F7D5C|nr:TonB-dependent receptor [Rubrivivax gelatinosus]MBK1688556.1 TonB-dependent receptor [Rubrivivax gelatinosus]